MRHNRLFAAGLAAALMLGAASPALAVPGKSQGKAKGHVNKPDKTKPPAPLTKGKKYGVSGGGSDANGEFSIQARPNSKSKGHFNWTSTDGAFKVHCHKGFASWTKPTPNPVNVTFDNCLITGQTVPGPVTVTVSDAGQHPTPPAKDSISFTIGANTYGGPLTDGNVKIR